MDNYICINGKKKALTDDQLKKLGFSPNDRTIVEIVEIIRQGKARDHYSIHDTLALGGYEMEIIGFDHDKVVDDPERHTITLMSKTLLPARRISDGACKKGWIDTGLRGWLNNDFIMSLPEELVKHIPAVVKTTHSASGEVYETHDTLFVLSESELFGSAIWSNYEDGPRYEAFATSELRVRVDEDGDGCWYWSRSSYAGSAAYFCAVGYSGGPHHGSATSAHRVPLCFCLA